MRTYYQPGALESTHQEKKEPAKVQAVPQKPDMPTPFPLPNPMGLLPAAFAYPVSITPAAMPQVLPQALLQKMMGAKEGEGVRVLDTPGGHGQGDPLGGMQRNDLGNRPHVETVDVSPEAHVPQVETFPAGKGPQVTTETFPAPNPSAHGPTMLMAKEKLGGGKDEKQEQSSQKLFWSSWSDYPKVTLNGKEYAKIGERLYTKHAVDRMLPKTLGIPAGTDQAGRGCAPGFVEEVIKIGEQQTIVENDVSRTIYSSGNIKVVTEQNGSVVVTVLRIGDQ